MQDSSFQIYGASSILVEGITFKSLQRNVLISGASNDLADSIVVRYVIGTDLFGAASAQESFGGFSVSGNSNIRVESSLFYNVHGGDTAAALEVFGYDDNALAIVTNVTAAYNGARGMQLGCFQCSGVVFAYNNILYNNTSGDLDTRLSSGAVDVFYSDLNPAKVAGIYGAVGNINADPQFENPLNNDFLLLNTSPAINTGAPENLVSGGYASQDLDGGARIVGSRVDMGAYESTVNDLVSQTVTSALDNAFDATLRTAITTANGNPNATTINFNLGNAASCPEVITLYSPLPDVTTDITINGFSEAGSKINTQYLDYDGKICVILRASGSVAHALRANGPGARLTVKGIEFEGFTTAAVRIADGSGSIVTGNGFAAVPGSAANDAGIRIETTATDAVIGGLSPGLRNVFDQGSYGIHFASNGTAGGHLVEGNFFGFNFDTSAWTGAKMSEGIHVVGSGGNAIGYNSIGNLNSYGILLTGANTTANNIIANGIGVGPDNAAATNGNAGIGIDNGAHGNVIGAPSGQSGGGNYIVNNFGPGVWIESGAGNGNRVDGNNAIHDNSGFLAVDLSTTTGFAAFGPTLNDSTDVDTGPNKLQNYPYLSAAKRIEANTVHVNGYILPESNGVAKTYRIDIFWTDTCLYSGSGSDTPRGEMKRYIGYFYVPTNGSATFVAYPNGGLDMKAPATVPSTGYLFGTATDPSGNSSEPGPCYTLTNDYIFANGFN